MSGPMCLRCLRRSLSQIESAAAVTNGSQRATFSTSSPLAANPVKKKGAATVVSAKGGRTLRLTKNKRAANAKPPAVGERKALRKRVVLSNTNALEVAGMQDLTGRVAHYDALDELRGTVLGFTNDTVDTLRALETFKPTQGWSLFRRPASLIRDETVSLASGLDWVMHGTLDPESESTLRNAMSLMVDRQDRAYSPLEKQDLAALADWEAREPEAARTIRAVLYGKRGSGKSVLQMQALAMASLKRWVVVHIPEAKDLVNAQTSYQPISTPEGTLYIQPHYTAKLLENVFKANQAVLSRLRLSQQHKLPITLPADVTLARLAELGSKDPDLAYPVWEALWSELLSPSQPDQDGLARPPVLFSLDGVDHTMRLSSYLNAETEPIHAHELTLIRQFVNLLSGKTALPNGGMVLGAVSESNRAAALTLDRYLPSKRATRMVREGPVFGKDHSPLPDSQRAIFDPYVAQDKWVQEVMESPSLRTLEVRGLNHTEARGIIEYYARSGMMRNTVTDGLVNEKWTLSGGGVIGQLEHASVRARF